MGVALSIALALAAASLACAIHALVPGLYTRSASRRIAGIHARLAARAGLEASAAPSE
jgi:hypothetical protein